MWSARYSVRMPTTIPDAMGGSVAMGAGASYWTLDLLKGACGWEAKK
jgi:hypothetical protein